MKTTYIDGRNTIYEDYLKSKEINFSRSFLKTHSFNLVSAHFYKFFPDLDFSQHYDLYNQILLHNRLTHFEQHYDEVFNYVTTENLSEDTYELIKNNPCIFSSFHFGSYRLLNTFLIKNKIPYTIVCPKSILEKEEAKFREIYANGGENDDSKFIEAESPTLGLQIIRELKKGRSIFVYFDGYRGATKEKDSESDKIKFLDQEIFVKTGVAHLANIAKVPLITTLSYRKNIDDIRLHFFDAIMPDLIKDRHQHALDATTLAHDRFSEFLKKYPGQWESWLYLHKQLESNEENILKNEFCENVLKKGVVFNSKRYGIFKILEDSFLFDRFSYITYPIDTQLYISLEKMFENIPFPIENEIKKETIKELYSNQVLVSA